MNYAHPEYLVETEWVAEHLNDPKVRVVESDEDALLYRAGHIPGAVQVDWFSTLQDPVRRDFLTREKFEQVASSLGISNDTTVVFYGDKSNWFACYALWLFQYYGHQNVRVMNGGRLKWERENRPLVKEGLIVPGHAIQGQGGRQDRAGVPRRGVRTTAVAPAAGRRPLAEGVLGRAHLDAELSAGGCDARRAYPDCCERALGAGCQ